MAYTVRTTGRAALKSFDIQCPACTYHEERSVDVRDCETEEQVQERIDRDTLITCPNCEGMMERVWLKAPGLFDRHGTDKEIAKYKKYSHERFVKKDVDDVRHKHGVNYDDSIRSATAQKIKKRTAKKT